MTPEQLEKAAAKLGELRGIPVNDADTLAANADEIKYIYNVLEALNYGLDNQVPFNQEKSNEF
tara:strand:- start:1141 stop:1329 length:189 start_codon:yes stop_codon:yes gene_type:complete